MKMKNNNLINESKCTFKTGDIILFSGQGLISNSIKLVTGSRWSHVGMVIRISSGFEMVAIWESTTLKTIKDSKTSYFKGVQLNQLRERIIQYDGDVALRQLEGVEFSDEDLKKLNELRRNLTGKPYEKSKLELIKSAYDGVGGANKEDLSSIFCSELVAEAYQILGILPEEIPSSEYVPRDFSEQAKNPLNFLKGKLGPEIIIKDM